MSPAEGTQVGPYRLERLLGRGGMAVVYEATHESAGRTVALKLIAPDLADPDFVERFRREGRMQAALDHPHVLPVYEAGTSDSGPFLAMQLVHGATLAALISDGVLTAERTLALLGQVAEALDAAHAKGLVHRDVKPRNVLVGDGDHAYLADFGLTRATDTEGATVSGQFMGTLAYVAPEVVRGERAGPAADRYALAAVLFECLTGTAVFPRPTQAAVLFAHMHSPPPHASARRNGIPPALDAVFVAGLAKDPVQRPKTAAELIKRARTALAGSDLAPPVPRLVPGGDDTTTGETPVQLGPAAPAPRRSWPALVLAALAGLLVGAAIVALLTAGDDDESAPPARAIATVQPAPPVPAGMQRLGSPLTDPGPARDCRGQAASGSAPACTALQERLAGATLAVPRNGVIRQWGLRSATGEFALTVLRRRDAGYFQVSRSRNEFVSADGVHVFPADLTVEQGDRIGLQVVDGSVFGTRPAPGATTARVFPQVGGAIQATKPGTPGELLVFADYLPGGKRRFPERLTAAEAAAAPRGDVLLTKRTRMDDGRAVEVRVIAVDGRGWLDVQVGGKPFGRIAVPDLEDPIQPGMHAELAASSNPLSVGMYLTFVHAGSDRLYHHYFVVEGRQLKVLD